MSRIDSAYEKFIDEFAEPFNIPEEQSKDEMFKLGVQKAIMSFACPNSFEVGPQMGTPECSTHCIHCWKEEVVLINESV